MTQHDWSIAKFTGVCARSGRSLGEGEEFVSALISAENEVRRIDFSLTEWNGPPDGALGYFRGRVPTREKPRRPAVDEVSLFEFFERLRDETDAARVRFRFVLALMLMRKRVLRFEASERTDEGETWVLRAPSDNSMHRVANPELSEEEAKDASEQLAALLGTADTGSELGAGASQPSGAAPIGGANAQG